MVSSLLVEALSSPTEALLELYNAQSAETHNEFPAVVTKHFSDVFKAEDAFREVVISRLFAPTHWNTETALSIII